MKNFFEIIKKSPLFSGIDGQEFDSMMGCLSARAAEYGKGQYIFHAGDGISDIGMVVSGSVHLVKEDFWGNRNIITKIKEGETFGEVFACISEKKIHVSVVAEEKTTILYMNLNRILTTCTSSCNFHARLIQNLVTVLAEKAYVLTKKVEHISKRTTREKVLSYLSERAEATGSNQFAIPFNRQELADYLSVDRSAMSNELSKMRDEGMLEFNKNRFVLKYNKLV